MCNQALILPLLVAQDADECDTNRFAWRSVKTWQSGVWVPSKMVTTGIEWTERQMIPMNEWKNTIPLWKVVLRSREGERC